MPFSDPLCAQYSLSVIKNLSRGNRRFFSCCRTDKRKNLPLQIHYIKRRPVCQYDAPAPFAGDPRPLFARPPVRESHTFAGDLRPSCLFWGARSPSVTPRVRRLRDNSDPFRGRPPPLVSFLVARDPPRSHAGCATETTQIRKPARIGPQAFPKASPKPQKALRQAPKALRQATSPKCTENPPKNRIISAKDPSIKNTPANRRGDE